MHEQPEDWQWPHVTSLIPALEQRVANASKDRTQVRRVQCIDDESKLGVLMTRPMSHFIWYTARAYGSPPSRPATGDANAGRR